MATLKTGDQAPLFEGVDQYGNKITLKSFLGKKIILYFYPKDDTPGCTTEACNLRDNYNELQQNGLVVIGVSADDINSHQKFASKYELPFHLLADTDKKIIKAYGVWGTKSMYGKTYEGILRTTYIISEKGKILHVFNQVNTKNHTQQILEAIV